MSYQQNVRLFDATLLGAGTPLSPKRANAVQAAQRAEAEAIAALEDSAARTRRPPSPVKAPPQGALFKSRSFLNLSNVYHQYWLQRRSMVGAFSTF